MLPNSTATATLSDPGPRGTVDDALSHARRLLGMDPVLAAQQAREILAVSPHSTDAMLILGRAFARLGQSAAAVEAFRQVTEKHPKLADAWLALGDQLRMDGDPVGADAAYARSIRASTHDPRLLQPAAALCENRIAEAEALLRAHLLQHPTDVAAIRMLAEVAARLGRYGDAQTLLERCLELAPTFAAARHNLAITLHRRHQPLDALREIDTLLSVDPGNPGYTNFKAAVLARIGDYDLSIELYESALAAYPNQPKVWMSYGHALKTAGRSEESITAYRRSIALEPRLGEAYWSLANLKTFTFTQAELAAMKAQLRRKDLTRDDELHFHFALGKAKEDSNEHADAFEHYAVGNRLRRAAILYDAPETTSHVERCRSLFTRAFFDERKDHGHPAGDPIFIVGLPRAGSTLLEQVLSSHPLVEGTMELPDILSIAKKLGERKSRSERSKYPEVLETLDADALRELGQRYLDGTRIQRKTSAPYFVDKMPNNFLHIGLIQLILPNARIIDARRHPLACCFSGFKQHFARGQHFTYDLEDIGHYYRDYVALMAHFEAVLPGRVLRVHYESMVHDTEAEVRRVLDYCGLPFDARCLRFHENLRAVRTASSEQVRRPIYTEGVEQWRHFDSWLEPLRRALGSLIDTYPIKKPDGGDV